jgi:hypothetical protein
MTKTTNARNMARISIVLGPKRSSSERAGPDDHWIAPEVLGVITSSGTGIGFSEEEVG